MSQNKNKNKKITAVHTHIINYCRCLQFEPYAQYQRPLSKQHAICTVTRMRNSINHAGVTLVDW